MNKNRIRIYTAPTDRIYYALAYALLALAGLVVLIPLIFVVASSFSSPSAVMAGKVYLLPVEFSLKGYQMILGHSMLMLSIRNTLYYTFVGTAINLFMTIIAAYPLSRPDLKLRKPIMMLFTITMLFSGGMIPSYLLIRSLKMIDTAWAMVIPGALSVWNMIVMRTYFQTSLPGELRESANLDGCDDIRFLVRIAIPLSTPIIAVNVLWYAVGHWNAYMNGFLYLNTPDLYPLQLVLRDILITDSTSGVEMDLATKMEREELKALLKYSTIVVSSVPVMLLYPVIQKYFVKGVMLGSLKG